PRWRQAEEGGRRDVAAGIEGRKEIGRPTAPHHPGSATRRLARSAPTATTRLRPTSSPAMPLQQPPPAAIGALPALPPAPSSLSWTLP
ncbi:unnamed protein product, partial [Ectocarpus sp. 12 AP-2014]